MSGWETARVANGGGGARWSRGVRPGAPGSRATRLELFYDLVFVFAFLNVTTLTATYPSVHSVVRALLGLALLWWCWSGFAGLGNVVRTDQGVLPVVGFTTVAAAFLLALTLPEAFTDRPGGLPGPLVFAGCYLLVRGTQVAVLGWVSRADPELRRRWLVLALPVLVATVLLVAAGVVPQRLADGSAEALIRLAFWLAAIFVEYGVGLLVGGVGWQVVSSGHWAERHALIILVALGETIISLGLGPQFIAGLPLTWAVVVAAVCGIAVASVLWWAYFDTLALAVEQLLHRTREPRARIALARDAYTYLHLPMIAGIIFFALGLKGLLAHVAEPSTPRWGDPLSRFDLLTLYGGVVLYLVSLGALALRALRIVRWVPLTAVVLIVGLVPVVRPLPEMVALGLLALVCVLLAGAQTVTEAGHRARVRQVALEEQLAAEAEQSEWRRRHL
ncbi:low temperature requirement protein A [Micromonospora globispora]|uniref:low temperature requirement protein A n=1 Tax=Micromonospora globispora TaxID=1450148 RepID=UPI000D6EF528|nr:low temperature requirement protein A [Micromonospora globispora]PWU59242.1 low temperature requirement protein A [Micromonospora globispora]RQW96437.1 low temperature requirement protein A [Micromonospora globispora]